MRGRGRAAAVIAALTAVALTGCAPALPSTVIPGTTITMGWTGEFTSTNAAAAPTSGNTDIAATLRAGFGDVVEGEFVPDESFGTATIVSDDPFTVRYDLTEPAWSDGIPLDAADLLLGWAGASGYFAVDAEAEDGTETDAEADAARPVPRIDEFARAIEVTYPQPLVGWQGAITVPVPAHVVGRLAFGTDDAMEAKQAVIRAIEDEDASALAEISEAWNEGFALPASGDLTADTLVSSGPFRVSSVEEAGEGQRVTLVPNAAYRGLVTPQVAEIVLTPPGDDPIGAIGETVDIIDLAPVTANRELIDQLERKDFAVNTSDDGTMWTLQLNPSGVFSSARARAAFLRAVPANALVERGSGAWASAYAGSLALLAAPGSRPYEVVSEDSGFVAALGTPADDPIVERDAAGVGPGARVCVLYDRASEFATGAFTALRLAAGEAGWNVADCGSDDMAASIAQRGWNAVISRVPVPQTPAQIAAQWGTAGAASLTGSADAERDALIAELAQTTDVYAARDLRAQIEASIVRAAVALPLTMNPRVTVVDKDVTGIAPRNGAIARLTSGVTQWAVIP